MPGEWVASADKVIRSWALTFHRSFGLSGGLSQYPFSFSSSFYYRLVVKTVSSL